MQNSTGKVVTEIDVLLLERGGGAEVTKQASSLEPGESLTIEHSMNDFGTEISYRIGDATYSHGEAYVRTTGIRRRTEGNSQESSQGEEVPEEARHVFDPVESEVVHGRRNVGPD